MFTPPLADVRQNSHRVQQLLFQPLIFCLTQTRTFMSAADTLGVICIDLEADFWP